MPYIRSIIKAGKTIEVHEGFSSQINNHKSRQKRRKITKEEMEEINKRNAEVKLRQKMNANFKAGDLHLILKYRKEVRPTPSEAKKCINKFIKALRKIYKVLGKELKYIQATEYKNKAIHHHLIINDVEGQNIAKLVAKIWTYARPYFVVLDSTGQYGALAEYIIKETDKTFRDKENNIKQRYTCSRNLIIPKSKPRIIKKTASWASIPKPFKGYYIDMDTVELGTSKNGFEFRRYVMVRLE